MMDISRLLQIVLNAVIIGCVLAMWIVVPAITPPDIHGLWFVTGIVGGVALFYAREDLRRLGL
jgi:hypothetical protein